jgi:hypothetical protein
LVKNNVLFAVIELNNGSISTNIRSQGEKVGARGVGDGGFGCMMLTKNKTKQQNMFFSRYTLQICALFWIIVKCLYTNLKPDPSALMWHGDLKNKNKKHPAVSKLSSFSFYRTVSAKVH